MKESNVSSFAGGYNPELPVLKRAGLYVVVELLHVVEVIVSNRSPGSRQLFLVRAARQRQQWLPLRNGDVGGWFYTIKRARNWTYLMEELSSSISSRSLLTSSCNCCLSCWSFPMCSTVFCNVTALVICMHEGGNWKREKVKQKYHHSSPLIFHRGNQTRTLTFDWVFRVGTRLQSVLKPMLMWLRLFCSEDMCVDLWPCHTASVEISPKGTENMDFSFLCIFLYFLYLYRLKLQSVQKLTKQGHREVHQPVFVHSLSKVRNCCWSAMLDLRLDLTHMGSLYLILVCCELQIKKMFMLC